MADSFYAYQRRRLGLLLGWGLGCVAVAPLALASRDPLARHAGLQAAVWGAIDAGIALVGRRSAGQGAARAVAGTVPAAETRQAARGFRRILRINVALDAGYVLAGAGLLARAGARRDRRGMGLGILSQGLFLLIYDSALAVEVGRRWRL